MNLANKFTIARILLVPVFVIIAQIGFVSWNYFAAAIFIVAAVTDMVDGKIARKYDMITNFGKLVDPIADKLLNGSAMIVLVSYGSVPAVVAAILMIRDHSVNAIRTVAAQKNLVIAARSSGKLKTLFQIIAFSAYLLGVNLVGDIMLYIALAFTVYSMYDYIYANKHVVQQSGLAKYLSMFLDKTILSIVMLFLVGARVLPLSVGVVFIGRDLIASAVQSTCAARGKQVGERISSVLNTLVLFIAYVLLIVGNIALGKVFILIAIATSIISAFDYVLSNRDIIFAELKS